MNLQTIKAQVKIESPDMDDESADCIAKNFAKVALDKYCVFRHRGDTHSEIYHNTLDALTASGFTFDMAKIAVAYAVVTRK